jgi:hypothetical protein
MTSGLIISTMLTEKKKWLLPLAVAFHSFFNYFASVNDGSFLFRTGLVFSAFVFLCYFSENDYAQLERLSQALRRFTQIHKPFIGGSV